MKTEISAQFRQRLIDGKDISYLAKKIGVTKTSKSFITDLKLADKYLRLKASEMTEKRIAISVTAMLKYLFGNEKISNFYCTDLCVYIRKVVEEEFKKQKKVFVYGNKTEMDVNRDSWRLFYHRGPNLIYREFDFKMIKVNLIRKEIKFYAKYHLNSFKKPNDSFLRSIAKTVNFITDNNKSIMCFADISKEDVSKLYIFLETGHKKRNGENLSVTSIKTAIHSCGRVVKYLMSEIRDENLRTPKPMENYFSSYKFRNIEKLRRSTNEIPEIIFSSFEKHIDELSEMRKAIYTVFTHTGLRAGEVLALEDDCIESSKYENIMQLKYTPHKVLSARRKKGIGDYRRMLIPMFLAEEIMLQIERSKAIRERFNSSYIFSIQSGTRCYLPSYVTFCNELNKLIFKHNIKHNGALWHFSCRQFRKTIAVSLIESGASTNELAYWLGHLTNKAAIQYYEDVREKKLVEMNTEFFKRRFDIILSKQQLEKYSEEDRRFLYIDFRLGQRRVELGFCMRQFSDGSCSERNRLVSCVNCKNLCTGIQYLKYWQDLRNSQYEVIHSLEDIYHSNNVEGYMQFKEYQQEKFLLTCYESIIEKINLGAKEKTHEYKCIDS